MSVSFTSDHSKVTLIQIQMLVLFLFALRASALQVRYVRPIASLPMSCPDEQCYTLDQYIRRTAAFFTTGSTFIFLDGNHNTTLTIRLKSVSNITLKSMEADSDRVFVNSLNRVFLGCNRVTNLTIMGLKIQHNAALSIFQSTSIFIKNALFQAGSTTLIKRSSVTILNSLFVGNEGDVGVMYATQGSVITIRRSIFKHNKGITLLGEGGAISLDKGTTAVIDTCIFEANHAGLGGAVHMELNAVITITDSLFVRNSGEYGGAIIADRSSRVVLNASIFVENNAVQEGGAIKLKDRSILISKGSIFDGNRAVAGGAVFALESNIEIISDERFSSIPKFCSLCLMNNMSSQQMQHCSASDFMEYACKNISQGISLFKNNVAVYDGGAIYTGYNLTFSGSIVEFKNNSAIQQNGGAVHADQTVSAETVKDVNVSTRIIHFEANRAGGRGGAMYVAYSGVKFSASSSAVFLSNEADSGGAILLRHSKATFKGINAEFENNMAHFGGAVYGENGDLDISTSTKLSFTGNFAEVNGGAVRLDGRPDLLNPNLENYAYFFANSLVFLNNKANGRGGAIYLQYFPLCEFGETVMFSNNTAEFDGGAIYALESSVYIHQRSDMAFNYNSAQNGGAMYFNPAAFLYFHKKTHLSTSHNHAVQHGGVIYHEDVTVPSQCDFNNETNPRNLPRCFIQIEFQQSNLQTELHSFNDTSIDGGDFMYGGLLDRCILNSKIFYEYYNLSRFFNDFDKARSTTYPITSRPYKLCFCESNSFICEGRKTQIVHRGQDFNVSVIALDQMRNSTSTTITAKISKNGALKINQSSQVIIKPKCSHLAYSIFSIDPREELTLYPDGPCRESGLARVIIDVILQPCPEGFTQEEGRCICEERLRDTEYDADCIIDQDIYILRKAGYRYWINASYHTNGSYEGLIRYKTCPTEYCKNAEIKISLNNPDIQCANNRGGVLCGACRANYSLMFGSSRCAKCSNAYLSLLIAFAAAGIALVCFLSVLRLTVATGMINGLILYANIVQVNREYFFQNTNTSIFLSVFIAWLNLDLGIETCFYRGMNSYGQTWLQFVFPVYIWILISLIIVISRYSITVSKLIGHNPIAVLATLLLMSYTKMLKVITDVYSPVYLDYPDKIVTAWLKDANTVYFQSSEHRLLVVFTSFVVLFLFLPYTILLLVGHVFYRLSGRRHFHWLNRLKPLLDSYYAPYRLNTRYWTGLLLLVRCALYVVFSFNSLGGSEKSLFTIIITFMSLIGFAYTFIGKIYIKTVNNFIEMSIYLNLIILSASSLAKLNSAALVYSLVSLVFVTMICIILYHFYFLYVAKLTAWKELKMKLVNLCSKSSNTSTSAVSSVGISSHDPHKFVTKTLVDLREPCLQ